MKKHTKILIFIGALFLGFFLVLLTVPGFYKIIMLKPRYNRLIYKTDHHALLSACRQLMDEGYRGKHSCKWPHRDPEANNFPKIILDLKPTYVWIHDKDYVDIELLGGMSHFGVKAYAEDFNEPHEKYYYGNRKLIDGLWINTDIFN